MSSGHRCCELRAALHSPNRHEVKLMLTYSPCLLARLGGVSQVDLTPVLSRCPWCGCAVRQWQGEILAASEGICCHNCLHGAHLQRCLQLSLAVARCSLSSGDCPGLCERSIRLTSAHHHCVTTPLSPELTWEKTVCQAELPGGPGAFSGGNGS